MIQYSCVKCGSMLESPNSMAGRADKCPLCGATCIVPYVAGQGRLPVIVAGGGIVLAIIIVAVILLVSGGKGESAKPVAGTPVAKQTPAVTAQPKAGEPPTNDNAANKSQPTAVAEPPPQAETHETAPKMTLDYIAGQWHAKFENGHVELNFRKDGWCAMRVVQGDRMQLKTVPYEIDEAQNAINLDEKAGSARLLADGAADFEYKKDLIELRGTLTRGPAPAASTPPEAPATPPEAPPAEPPADPVTEEQPLPVEPGPQD